MSTHPKDAHLFDLFCGAVARGLEYVRLADSGRTYIGNHSHWPTLLWQDNGLPYIHNTSDGPKNYSDAIGSLHSFLYALGTDERPLDFSKEPEFLALVEYAQAEPRLRRYCCYDEARDSDGVDFRNGILRMKVGYILDRYVHTTGLTTLDVGQLLPVYRPIEKELLDECLPMSVMVPILCLKFDSPNFALLDSVSVERIPDDLHLAGAWRPFGGSDSDIDVATHGLFLSNYTVSNESFFARARMELESFPTEVIDTFFAALRIATGYFTGYARILMIPHGWASSYAADLTPIDGPKVEKFPRTLKRCSYISDVPTLSQADVDKTRKIFEGLRKMLKTPHGRKLRVAVHRLNLSALRTTDEDGVIDAMIAMEALLSAGDDKQEMTHKVAMRLAALYKVAQPERSAQAFRELKRIYTFRSKVVHGASDFEKYRQFDREGNKISAVDAAVEHLRTAFSVLAEHPSLLDPSNIDGFLLTDKLFEHDSE